MSAAEPLSRFAAAAAAIDWSSMTVRAVGWSLLHPAPADPDPALPADVGETGCGPDGEFCTGRPTGETSARYLSTEKG